MYGPLKHALRDACAGDVLRTVMASLASDAYFRPHAPHFIDYTGNASAKMDVCEELCLMTSELPELNEMPWRKAERRLKRATGRNRRLTIRDVSKKQQFARRRKRRL